jgi:hypothetical protein
MTEQVLDDMERMLNFRPYACLEMRQFFEHASQLVFGQCLALGALHRHVPSDRLATMFFTLCHTLVIRIAKRCRFVAMQQRVRLRHIRDVASRAAYS